MVVQRAGAVWVSRAEMRDAVGCRRLCRNVARSISRSNQRLMPTTKGIATPLGLAQSPDASETMQRPENT